MLVTAAAAILLLVFIHLCRRLLRRYLIAKYTILHDLELVGTGRKGARLPGTAIVCGGSIAGLFAARVCSDHFDKVVVVEPDAWTFTREAREPAPFDTREVEGASATYKTLKHGRKRVPQYTTVHTYQAILLRFARKVFPGFDVAATGWGMMIRAADYRMSLSGHTLRPPVGEYNGVLPNTLWAPRRNFEALVRKMIHDGRPEIEFVEGTLTGFQLNDVGSIRTIHSVVIRLPNGQTREIGDFALVMDCTGAAQAGFKALSRILPALSERGPRDTYGTNIAYSSFEYPLPPKFYENLNAASHGMDDTAADFAYIPDPDVDNKMVCILRRDEGGVLLIIGGWNVDPPVTLDGVRSFVKQIKHPEHIPDRFYKAVDLLKSVEHLGIVHPSHVTSCQNIHYERLSRDIPCNYIAIGDSAMRVNPRFGQGVAKCTIGAVTLDALLRKLAPTDRKFGASFFSKMRNRTESIWDETKLADYTLDATTPITGESRHSGRFKLWYRAQLIRSMNSNPAAASAMWHTMMFLAPPIDVFSPSIVAGIAWDSLVSWLQESVQMMHL